MISGPARSQGVAGPFYFGCDGNNVRHESLISKVSRPDSPLPLTFVTDYGGLGRSQPQIVLGKRSLALLCQVRLNIAAKVSDAARG